MSSESTARVLRLAETLRGLAAEFHGLRFLADAAPALEAYTREAEALRAENDRLRLGGRAPEPVEGLEVTAR